MLKIETFDHERNLNAIVETPSGSRNKFKYDGARGLYTLAGVLPAGAVFPFDFGFLPATKGQDGDPLDILVLMDAPTYPGCLVTARLLGVVEASQTENGKTERNDRLIATAVESRNHRGVEELSDLSENLLHEIEHFFISYNQAREKQFKVLGRFGPDHALRVVEEGIAAATGTSGL